MKKFLPSIAFIGLAALTAPSAFATVDGGITSFGNVYAEPNAEFEFFAKFNNKGDVAVTSISYTEIIDDVLSKDYTLELPSAIAAGDSKYVSFKAVAPSTNDATTTMRIKLTAINGVAVTKSNVSGRVKTASFVPKVRSIVEDYTGTWCGYCPRGFVAMESMARDYPGQILGVAYHYDDPMDLSTFSEPTSVSGYPSLYQNRDYVANANNAAELSLKASNGLAAAAVNMESAEWLDEEFSQAKGTATVEFGEDVTNGQYMVEFILIEDGVGGTSSGWMQCDYYYGGSAGDWDDPLWNQFLNNPDNVFVYEHNGYTYYYIRNLTFNDVCIANTRVSKSGFTSSIPATAARTPITFEYTFDGVNSIVENVSDSSREILMTPEKCKIAVVVTEKSSGAFVNCDWLTIGGEQSGVKTVQADDSNVNAEKEYFNLSGMKIAADNLTPGIYIVRQGNKTSKVVIR